MRDDEDKFDDQNDNDGDYLIYLESDEFILMLIHVVL